MQPTYQIAGYELLQQLGAGGMGAVYLGRHRVLGRLAAIKVLRADGSSSPKALLRFVDEARAAARLQHPAIAQVFDCDQLPNGQAYIVMEYLAGLSLREVLENESRVTSDLRLTVGLLGEVALGLSVAHQQGIIHRDVKPENLLLVRQTRDPQRLQAKVLDFGIAKLADPERLTTLTNAGSLVGTPNYMSPEQCIAAPDIDARADIYSLGCIAFELFSGRRPFVATSLGAMLLAHTTEVPPRLTEIAPQVPEELADLVARMLAKTPADRPHSMDEVCAALAGYLNCSPTDFTTCMLAPDDFPHRGSALALAGSPTASILPTSAAPGTGLLLQATEEAALSLHSSQPLFQPAENSRERATTPQTTPLVAEPLVAAEQRPQRSSWQAATLGAALGVVALLVGYFVVTVGAGEDDKPERTATQQAKSSDNSPVFRLAKKAAATQPRTVATETVAPSQPTALEQPATPQPAPQPPVPAEPPSTPKPMSQPQSTTADQDATSEPGTRPVPASSDEPKPFIYEKVPD